MRFGLEPAEQEGEREYRRCDLPRNSNVILAVIVKQTGSMEEELNRIVKYQEDHG